jgi:hypothetical protein
MRTAPLLRLKCWDSACPPRLEPSTDGIHFSGEPFDRYDIQFQDPEVGIESPAGRSISAFNSPSLSMLSLVSCHA